MNIEKNLNDLLYGEGLFDGIPEWEIEAPVELPEDEEIEIEE